jgi:hypothetical protein
MSTSRGADGQRNSLHPTGRPGTMRRPVPQRRASDCECRCRPRRCQWPGDLDTAHEHQSTQHPPSVQSHLRNFAAAMATCVQARTTSAARLSTQLCCCELQRRCRRTPGGAARSAWERQRHAQVPHHQPDSAGIFNPNPASPDDGEGNRAVNHSLCGGWKLFTHA